jgi:hypothetical protein
LLVEHEASLRHYENSHQLQAREGEKLNTIEKQQADVLPESQSQLQQHQANVQSKHRVLDAGPRLTLLSPLHWSVHEVSDTDLGTDGQLKPIVLRCAIFNLTTEAVARLNFMYYLNTPAVGQHEIPLPTLCSAHTLSSGVCEFSLAIPPWVLGAKGTFVAAARLVSPSNYAESIGAVSEVSFRVQPRVSEPWSQSSCSRGFFKLGTPHPASCLADPFARPRPPSSVRPRSAGPPQAPEAGAGAPSVSAPYLRASDEEAKGSAGSCDWVHNGSNGSRLSGAHGLIEAEDDSKEQLVGEVGWGGWGWIW